MPLFQAVQNDGAKPRSHALFDNYTPDITGSAGDKNIHIVFSLSKPH
jgi:hypothetical protein